MKNTALIALLPAIGLLTGCGKSEVNSNLSVKLTDAPGAFDKVMVEISAVEVHYTGNRNEKSGWLELRTRTGIYDLLEYRNNKQATLADNVEIRAGTIDSVRLVLGGKNSVVVQGSSFNMQLASNSAQNCCLAIFADLEPKTQQTIVLDFNAEKSVSLETNGIYYLMPHLSVRSVVR